MKQNMGINARKPDLEGLRITKAQTSLHICAVLSVPSLFTFLERIMSKLASNEISLICIVSVADETGLSLTLLETPKTGFISLPPL